MESVSSPVPILARSPIQPTPHHFSPPSLSRSVSSNQFAMSWNDGFDFTSRSPLTSSLHMPVGTSPMSCSPGFYGDTERIPRLEKDFCTNFTCCGRSLADLHELLSHFEERHVIVMGPDGRPISQNSSPCSSLDLPLGPTTPPVNSDDRHDRLGPKGPYTSNAYGFPQVSASPPQSAFAMASILRSSSAPSPVYATRDQDSTSRESSSSISDDDDIMMDFDPLDHDLVQSPGPVRASSHESVCLPPALFTAPRADSASAISDPRKGRTDSRKISGRLKTRNLVGQGQIERPPPKRREKAHKCPLPGCTKSYLNPNGLKYHLSKGTCNISTDQDM